MFETDVYDQRTKGIFHFILTTKSNGHERQCYTSIMFHPELATIGFGFKLKTIYSWNTSIRYVSCFIVKIDNLQRQDLFGNCSI